MTDVPAAITVATPLYRSRRFVESIVANVRNLGACDAEVLLSDRHCADDALDELRKRLADDPRVRFIEAHDAVDWVAHCNLLLGMSRARYFIWMTHDDVFPPDYVPRLRQALERKTDAVLAFGATRPELIDPGARLPPPDLLIPPDANPERWDAATALKLLRETNLGLAFRGLFLREVAVRNDVLLPRTWGTYNADETWAFGMALLGRLVYVPEACCTKRFHTGSATSRWRYSLASRIGANAARLVLLARLCRSNRERVRRLAEFLRWKLSGSG